MQDLKLVPPTLGYARDDCSNDRARRLIHGRDFGSPSCVRVTMCPWSREARGVAFDTVFPRA
eukprot:1646656-Prymnesium_polylepis.1